MFLTVLAVIALGVGSFQSQSDVPATAFAPADQSAVVQIQKAAQTRPDPILDI